MKNYRMMLGALALALASVGCAATPEASSPTAVASAKDCPSYNQNMRPDWQSVAVRGEPGEVVWRPGIKKSEPGQEVVQYAWRPDVRQTSVASASCVEPDTVTY